MELTEERVREIVREEIANVGIKGKRKPNQYNLFIKKCLQEIETQGVIQERFKKCAMRYKEMKGKGEL